MAENELRCNSLRCRTYVAQHGKAVVTTCSHIFCVPCANGLFSQGSTCPACDQNLDQPNDIVEAYLNPSNDYKASILAGLPPGVIMEISARALSFWAYQTSQEGAFQAVLLRNNQEKLGHREQYIATLQAELQMANNKITNLGKELDAASRRVQDLSNQVRDNDKEMRRLRGNYDKIKTRALIGSTGQIMENFEGAPGSDASNNMAFQPRVPIHGTPLGNHPPHPFIPTPQVTNTKTSAAINRFGTVQHPNLTASRLTGPSSRNFRPGLAGHSIGGTGDYVNQRTTSESAGSEGARVQGRAQSRLAQRHAMGPSDFGMTR